MINPEIQNGPNLRVRINGFIQGYAQDLKYSIDQGQKPLFGVDSPFPQEIAQGAAPSMVSGSMTMFRIVGSSLEKSGIMGARTGGTPEGTAINFSATGPTDSQGTTGNSNSSFGETWLGASKYSVVEIEDRTSGNMVVKMSYVMFGTVSWQMLAKNVVQGTVTFQGILVSENEAPSNSSLL